MKLKALPSGIGRLPPVIKSPPKIAEGFYQSREWRVLMATLKRQRGGWCERCGSKHRIAGDHIVERKDGGADLDPSNIELLCQACHNAKTKRSGKQRMAERG